MLNFARSLSALLCLALCSCGATQNDIERRLLDSHNVIRHAGYSGLGPISSGELEAEGSQTLRTRLARDECYVVAAFGSGSLSDIGLTIVGPNEEPVAEARGAGRTAIVSFCTERSGEHLFNVTAEAGAGEYQVAYWFGESSASAEGGPSGNQITLGRAVQGTLAPGQRHIDYTLHIRQRRLITIDLESRDFDTYLYLLRDGLELDRNDDGGTGLNSQISIPVEPGTYTVRVGSFMDRGSGQFSLIVR